MWIYKKKKRKLNEIYYNDLDEFEFSYPVLGVTPILFPKEPENLST